jgi:hypothetical protein
LETDAIDLCDAADDCAGKEMTNWSSGKASLICKNGETGEIASGFPWASALSNASVPSVLPVI